MPPIGCPECGRQVASEAPTCPGCGAPVAQLFAPPEPWENRSGHIQIADAFRVGRNATVEYFQLWLGVGVVGTLLYIGSVITLIGIFLLCPIFVWGGCFFFLNTVDGKPRFSDLFAGFNDYGSRLGRMLGLLVIAVVPGQVLSVMVGSVSSQL